MIDLNEREKFFTEGEQMSIFDNDMKLIHRVSSKGKMMSESMSIDQPESLTVEWDTDIYCVESLNVADGELILKKYQKGDK